MRRYPKNLVIAAAFVFFVAGVSASVPNNDPGRFQHIPRRNVFDLKAPPKPQTAPPAEQPVPKLILTGITTILGNKRALLKEELPGPGGKQGQSQELSMMLTEGQSEHNVEVLQIDEKEGAVKVNNSGKIMTLTFEKDGPKLPNTPPQAGALPGAMAGIPPAPGTNGGPQLQTMNLQSNQLPARPSRMRRPWPMTGAATPQSAPTALSPTGRPGVPGAPLPAQAPTVVGEQEQLTPQEQQIFSQIQRETKAEAPPQPPIGMGNFQTPPPQGILPAFGVLPPPASDTAPPASATQRRIMPQ